MTRTARLTIRTQGHDPRGAALLAHARALGVTTLTSIEVAEIVFFGAPLTDPEHRSALVEVLVDPVHQRGDWQVPSGGIETTPLDRWSRASAQTARAALRLAGLPDLPVATGRRYEFVGSIDANQRRTLATLILSDPSTERWSDGPLDIEAAPDRAVESSHASLLTPAEADALAHRFLAAGRDPTTAELHTVALLWGDRCDRVFDWNIALDDGTQLAPLGRQLRDSANRTSGPSVSTPSAGGAGVASFRSGVTLALAASSFRPSVATDTSHSAISRLDTAVAEVLAARHQPIAATDAICIGPTSRAPARLPADVAHPRLVERRVVAELSHFNHSLGLPTMAGAVLVDRAYITNPVVHVGCIGVATNSAAAANLPGAQADDHLVIIIGRTPDRHGRDTASIASLVEALRDCASLCHAMAHCIGRALPLAVAAVADHVGVTLDINTISGEASGSDPIDAWLANDDALMVCAVDPRNWDAVSAACEQRGLHAIVSGTFTGDGTITVNAGDHRLVALDSAFLRDGRPATALPAAAPIPLRHTHHVPVDDAPTDTLLALLAHPNIASKERIVGRLDHDVAGTAVVRPVVGRASDAPADGVVLAPLADTYGVAIGVGVNPQFGLLDPERMAQACVDEAIRNVVAAGADPSEVSLTVNFNWRDPQQASALGELAVAVRGCCDASEHHQAPIVHRSATFDDAGEDVEVRRRPAPPTLVVTAVALVPDVERVCTPQLTRPGNVLVHVGRVANEFGGSHFAIVHDIPLASSGVVPAPDPGAPRRYRLLHQAIASARVHACHDVGEGGLAVALAEMCIAGRFGANVDHLPHPDRTVALFSESVGRFVCEVAPADLAWFVDHMEGDAIVLGEVTATRVLTLPDVSLRVDELVTAFKGAVS